MSLRFGSTKPTRIKITEGKSKFDSKQPIYVVELENVLIDGKEALYGRPEIILIVGNTYIFDIDCPKCPFYITSDPVGGRYNEKEILSMQGAIDIIPENSNEPGNVGITKGTLTWTPEFIHASMKLYYQCNYFPNMGNRLEVKVH